MDILYRFVPHYSYPYYSLPILEEITFDGEQPDAMDTFVLKNVSSNSYANSTKDGKSFIATWVHGDSSI